MYFLFEKKYEQFTHISTILLYCPLLSDTAIVQHIFRINGIELRISLEISFDLDHFYWLYNSDIHFTDKSTQLRQIIINQYSIVACVYKSKMTHNKIRQTIDEAILHIQESFILKPHS